MNVQTNPTPLILRNDSQRLPHIETLRSPPFSQHIKIVIQPQGDGTRSEMFAGISHVYCVFHGQGAALFGSEVLLGQALGVDPLTTIVPLTLGVLVRDVLSILGVKLAALHVAGGSVE